MLLLQQMLFQDSEKLESTLTTGMQFHATKKVKRTNSAMPKIVQKMVIKRKVIKRMMTHTVSKICKHVCRYHLLLSFVDEEEDNEDVTSDEDDGFTHTQIMMIH